MKAKNFIFSLIFCALAGTIFAEEIVVPEDENFAENDDEKISEAINSLPKIVEIRTNFFRIFGNDSDASRRVAHLARKLEKHVERVLGWKFLNEKMIVRVEIFVSENGEKISPKSEIRRGINGNKTCIFSGTIGDFSDFEIAFSLAETVVRQRNFSRGNAQNPPLWLPSALTSEAEISGEIGVANAFFLEIKSAFPLKFSELFEPEAAGKIPSKIFRENAFLFFRFLKKQRLPVWQRFSDFVEIVSENPKSAFPKNEKKSLDLLWATEFFSAIERLPEGSETLSESQNRFEKSLNFLVEIDGAERRISLRELADFHELLGVKKIAYAKMLSIVEALPKTNPVWHNAFTELGIFLEMIASRERQKSEILAQLEKVFVELEVARELQSEILEILKFKEKSFPQN